MPKILLLNPSLESNMLIITQLVQTILGWESGTLKPKKIYTIDSPDGTSQRYCLTLPVCQFIRNSAATDDVPIRRIHVLDLFSDAKGDFGFIFPVLRSIIFDDHNQPRFDPKSFIVKKIATHPLGGATDKPGKNNWYFRAAYREHYLASHSPTLGAQYQLITKKNHVLLHMNRAPGLPLDNYIGSKRLTTEQFLLLACTLLSQIPAQIHQQITYGKHKDKTVIHCDIKLNNIMGEWDPANKIWQVTAVDLGLAKTVRPGADYESKFRHGNTIVMDYPMFESLMSKTVIHYNEQSDLYALYVVISQLAGIHARIIKKDNSEFLADLLNPSLAGLFATMELDEVMKSRLTQHIQFMLTMDKQKRLTREQALQGFKEALFDLQVANTTSTTVKQSASADQLKLMLEENLTRQIKAKPQDETPILLKWIKTYRQSMAALGDQEASRLKLMEKEDKIEIQCHYIESLRRLNLVGDYPDSSCLKILRTHLANTQPLHTGCTIPTWATRFRRIHTVIPLQYHQEDKLFCEQLALFREHVQELSAKSPNSPLKENLVTQLQQQLEMSFNEWFAQLPDFIPFFNQQCAHLFEVINITTKFATIAALKPNFQTEFAIWAKEMEERGLNQQFLPENGSYFKKRIELIEKLTRFSKMPRLIPLFFFDYPLLNTSPYFSQKIKDLAATFKIANDEEVDNLIRNLTILLDLLTIYNDVLSRKSFLADYPGVLKSCKVKLNALIEDWSNEEVFIRQLNSLKQHMIVLVEMNMIVLKIKAHKYNEKYQKISTVIASIMESEEHCLALEKLFLGSLINWRYLPRLNASLINLSTSRSENINSLYLDEFRRFWIYPGHYTTLEGSFETRVTKGPSLFIARSHSGVPSPSSTPEHSSLPHL